MSEKAFIMTLEREADLYRKQGLVKEARVKYLNILHLLKESPQLCDTDLLESLKCRVEEVEEAATAFDEDEITPMVNGELQGLIKELFSYSDNEETAEIEGAVALAKFGQHEKALEEFHRLIDKGALPLLAAKNIIRCHLALSSPDKAIAQFRQWLYSEILTSQELKHLRQFLQKTLETRGIDIELPEVVETSPSEKVSRSDDFLDICSVTICFMESSGDKENLEFDVTFQSGDVISISIPAPHKSLIGSLQIGERFNQMQFYCPIALFRGSGVVSGINMVKHGPKKGDYIMDITIDDESDQTRSLGRSRTAWDGFNPGAPHSTQDPVEAFA
jgi:hypothetical protein